MFIRNTSKVQARTLIVDQIRISRKSKTAANHFAKCFIKCKGIAQFTNYYGMLLSGLLEADTNVISFTPRPFRLKVFGKPYIPDFFVTKTQNREVIDIEKEATPNIQTECLEDFFTRNSISYSVVTRKDLKKQQTKAESWLQIVSLLKTSEFLTTDSEENSILNKFASNDIHCLNDIVDIGDRTGSYLQEVALFRLMHGGYVRADLDSIPLYDRTSIFIC